MTRKRKIKFRTPEQAKEARRKINEIVHRHFNEMREEAHEMRIDMCQLLSVIMRETILTYESMIMAQLVMDGKTTTKELLEALNADSKFSEVFE